MRHCAFRFQCDIFHIRCLRKYIPPNTDFPTRFTPSSSESIVKDDGEEWDVEKILGTRVRRKKRQYLVRWTNYYLTYIQSNYI